MDHVLTTTSLDRVIGNFSILNDVTVSDHKPVSFCVDGNVCTTTTAGPSASVNTDTWVPNWQQCDENILMNYIILVG